jgi:5'-deoxynucleotidase YfbR-like HD superfamily hydrolase
MNAHIDNPFVSTQTTEFSLLAPTPSTVFPTDIAHALSHINRYTGHTERPINVLQHSFLCYRLARLEEYETGLEGHSREMLRLILAHDAAEAYVGDVSRPLKTLLGAAYGDIELRVEKAVWERFGLLPVGEGAAGNHAIVKRFDNLALSAEAHDLFPQVVDRPNWAGLPPRDDAHIRVLRGIVMQPLEYLRQRFVGILEGRSE